MIAILTLLACDPSTLFGSAPEGCTLTLEGLDQTTWVMLEAKPDKSEVPNHQARMQFFMEDGIQKVKYTVKSLGDVYTYECKNTKKDNEYFCAEKPRITDWCQALMVHESDSCTAEKLRDFGVEASDDEIAKAMAEAKANYDKFMNNKDPKVAARFALNNNNLGNKLRGMVYAKIDKRQCRLSVDDMYMTIHNGKKIEDFNPVGKNPFVQDEGNEYLWEHCDDGKNVVDLESAELPEDLSKLGPRKHTAGKAVYYQYVGKKAAKADEGCAYTYDSYAMWKPVQKGVSAATAEDGTLTWAASHTYAAEDLMDLGGAKGAVFTMVRYKECGGAKKKIDTICNAVPMK